MSNLNSFLQVFISKEKTCKLLLWKIGTLITVSIYYIFPWLLLLIFGVAFSFYSTRKKRERRNNTYVLHTTIDDIRHQSAQKTSLPIFLTRSHPSVREILLVISHLENPQRDREKVASSSEWTSQLKWRRDLVELGQALTHSTLPRSLPPSFWACISSLRHLEN